MISKFKIGDVVTIVGDYIPKEFLGKKGKICDIQPVNYMDGGDAFDIQVNVGGEFNEYLCDAPWFDERDLEFIP